MKIMIWVGYQKNQFNKKTWLKNGIGGSEYCAIKLSDYLDLQGHDVTIVGDVKEGNFWGVKYIHFDNLLRYRGPRGLQEIHELKTYEHYDVVIATNYLNYFKHLEDAKITFSKNYFWLHNTGYYGWYRGGNIPNQDEYLRKVDKIVGVSEYHRDILKDKFKALYDTPQQLDTYIHSIDNAICLDDYKNHNNESKIKNRIIWTSSPDRGLEFILDNWEDWKQAIPDLSLEICCPPYATDWFKRDISELKDVNWQGARCPNDLKREIAKAEYWIYMSGYNETYCISALEMLMGEVKCITTGTGNIKNIITPDRGVIIDMNPDYVKKILIKNNTDKEYSDKWRNKSIKAKLWAETQNWNERVIEWCNLINE